MLYYMDRLGRMLEEGITRFDAFLSVDRREKMKKYLFPIDQLQSVLVYVLLRYALSKEYGYRDYPTMQKDDQGKPQLAELPNLYFNVAHCKTGVACLLDTASVGVDIQDYVPFDEGLLPYFMSEEEKKKAMEKRSSVYFTRTWALKESYGKWLGAGILYDMPGYTVSEGQCEGYFNSSFLMPGFVLATTSVTPQFPQHVTPMEVTSWLSSV